MKDFLKTKLTELMGDNLMELSFLTYSEDIKDDADAGWRYKVATLVAIDKNKCDWVYVAIGTKSSDFSTPELMGTLSFPRGENDDISRIIDRAYKLVKNSNDIFTW